MGSNAAMENESCDIEVEVESRYMETESVPDQARYVFSYTVTIRNIGTIAARLHSRHWIITNGDGVSQEVRGEGVVGEQPHLLPGEGFRYTSAAMLETPVGSMHGSYLMVTDDGMEFDVAISPFSLACSRQLH